MKFEALKRAIESAERAGVTPDTDVLVWTGYVYYDVTELDVKKNAFRVSIKDKWIGWRDKE